MEAVYTTAFSFVGYLSVIGVRYFTGEFFTFSSQWSDLMELSQPNLVFPLMFHSFPRCPAGHYKEELLARSLDTMNNILDYLEHDIKISPLFDTIALTSAIQAQLSEVDMKKVKDKRVQHKIRSLIKFSKDIVDVGLPLFKAVDPQYYNTIGGFINPDLWANWTMPYKELPEPPSEPPPYAPIDDKFGKMTDICYSEVFRCVLTDKCWAHMTKLYETGYMTTHQVIYVMVAQKLCPNVSMEFVRRYNQTSHAHIYQDMCVNIFDEAKGIEAGDFDETTRDLYCEQIFICGLLGYHQFFNQAGLEAILSWKMQSGCYAHVLPITYLKLFTGIGKGRRKRNELLRSDLCLPHYTVVCGAALAVYIRYLVEAGVAEVLTME